VEEFEEQAATETAKALKELREFCSTPQSDPWKLQLSLKDPQRSAIFNFIQLPFFLWTYSLILKFQLLIKAIFKAIWQKTNIFIKLKSILFS